MNGLPTSGACMQLGVKTTLDVKEHKAEDTVYHCIYIDTDTVYHFLVVYYIYIYIYGKLLESLSALVH